MINNGSLEIRGGDYCDGNYHAYPKTYAGDPQYAEEYFSHCLCGKKCKQDIDSKVLERFWSKVNKTDECWLWKDGLTRGYGVFFVHGRKVAAHRFAYELFKGAIPEGLQIDHLCRVRNCVNYYTEETMRKLKWTVELEDLPKIVNGRVVCPFCDHPLPKQRTNKRKLLALAEAIKDMDPEVATAPAVQKGEE